MDAPLIGGLVVAVVVAANAAFQVYRSLTR
jgi:hypothetical protein